MAACERDGISGTTDAADARRPAVPAALNKAALMSKRRRERPEWFIESSVGKAVPKALGTKHENGNQMLMDNDPERLLPFGKQVDRASP
jgi:hypothetical protein